MALVNALSNIGLIGGPALTVIIVHLSWHWGPLAFNEYTLPGWLMAVLFAADIVMTAIFLGDPRPGMVCMPDEAIA